MSLPCGVVGWSVVCDCGISCSYSLAFLKFRISVVFLFFRLTFLNSGIILKTFTHVINVESPIRYVRKKNVRIQVLKLNFLPCIDRVLLRPLYSGNP